MDIEELELWEAAARTHGRDVADEAYRWVNDTTAAKVGYARAWQIALRYAVENDRFYAHETGAIRPAYAYID